MIIIGGFEHSLDLELLLSRLENNHIPRKHIIAVPMDIDSKNPFQVYSRRQALYYKGIEVGVASATGSSIIGASIGFIRTWGPVFWGLITAGTGFVIGFSIYIAFKKLSNYRNLPSKLPQVTVIVQCMDEQSQFVTDVMWKYNALSVGRHETTKGTI